MQLVKVRVEGYRSIGSPVTLHLDPRVTVVLGPNDHGKTNLLAALLHLDSASPFEEDRDLNWDRLDARKTHPAIRYELLLSDEEVEGLRETDRLVREENALDEASEELQTRLEEAEAASAEVRNRAQEAAAALQRAEDEDVDEPDGGAGAESPPSRSSRKSELARLERERLAADRNATKADAKAALVRRHLALLKGRRLEVQAVLGGRAQEEAMSSAITARTVALEAALERVAGAAESDQEASAALQRDSLAPSSPDATEQLRKAATAAKAAHQKEQRLLDQHELDLTVLQLAQEALSDYGAGTLPREVRPPIVKALPIGDVPTLVALERVGVDGDLRAVGLAFAGSQGIDFVMGLLPRVELIRPVDRLPDSVTRTQLVQPDFLFMRGVFHYAGLLEQEWDTIFSQDDATIRRLAEASERLNTTLKASWSQGRRLEFLLVHNSSSKRIELRIKDPAVQQQYVRASRRSSGFTHFFALKTILHAHEVEAPARSYIWVFDEPGVFLHPDGQHDLVQVMETLAQSNQVVYSTHSVFMANKNYPARHRLVVKTVGGTTLDGKPFRSRWRPAIEALGMSMPGTLLFASSVLIVEGDSDVILLNATLQFLIRIGKLDRDLNALGILAAGDSADAAALVRILKESTAAPRVAALFDGDSGGERRRKSLEGLGRSDLKIRLLTPKDSATEDHLPAACDLYPVALARYLAKISPRTAPDGSRLTEAQFLAEIEGRRTELETTKEGLTSGMADWARRIGREIGELDEEPSAVGLGREYALVLEDRPDDLGGGEAIRRSVQLARWIGETLDLPSLTLTGGAILVSQDVVEAELA